MEENSRVRERLVCGWGMTSNCVLNNMFDRRRGGWREYDYWEEGEGEKEKSNEMRRSGGRRRGLLNFNNKKTFLIKKIIKFHAQNNYYLPRQSNFIVSHKICVTLR